MELAIGTLGRACRDGKRWSNNIVGRKILMTIVLNRLDWGSIWLSLSTYHFASSRPRHPGEAMLAIQPLVLLYHSPFSGGGSGDFGGLVLRHSNHFDMVAMLG